MSDAFCAVDKEWRLVYINGQAEQITHCHRTDLLGKLFWDAFPETVGSAFHDHYHLKSAEGFRLRLEVFCPQLESCSKSMRCRRRWEWHFIFATSPGGEERTGIWNTWPSKYFRNMRISKLSSCTYQSA
jgi:PAS domain-containing protein